MEEEVRKEREEDERKRNEKRAVEDYERKTREAAEKREADEKRWKDEIERKAREAKDKQAAEEQRIKDKLERDAKEKKEKDAAAYKAFKEKERLEKEAKEREYNDFLREQKERADKEKRGKQEAEEKFQNEMRKRLASLGYTERTIEIMVDQEKAKQFKQKVEASPRGGSHDRRTTTTTTTTSLDLFQSPRAPVYPKVHRDYLAVETLKYYDLPWEYDRHNPDYIIILRDMDKRETDLLFEHTSRLRTGKLLLEPAKPREKQFALYRRRSKSRSGRPKEVGVIRLG